MPIENPNAKLRPTEGPLDPAALRRDADPVGARIVAAYGRSPGLVDQDAAARLARRFNRFVQPAMLATQVLSRWAGTAGHFYDSWAPLLFRIPGRARQGEPDASGDAPFEAERSAGWLREHAPSRFRDIASESWRGGHDIFVRAGVGPVVPAAPTRVPGPSQVLLQRRTAASESVATALPGAENAERNAVGPVVTRTTAGATTAPPARSIATIPASTPPAVPDADDPGRTSGGRGVNQPLVQARTVPPRFVSRVPRPSGPAAGSTAAEPHQQVDRVEAPRQQVDRVEAPNQQVDRVPALNTPPPDASPPLLTSAGGAVTVSEPAAAGLESRMPRDVGGSGMPDRFAPDLSFTPQRRGSRALTRSEDSGTTNTQSRPNVGTFHTPDRPRGNAAPGTPADAGQVVARSELRLNRTPDRTPRISPSNASSNLVTEARRPGGLRAGPAGDLVLETARRPRARLANAAAVAQRVSFAPSVLWFLARTAAGPAAVGPAISLRTSDHRLRDSHPFGWPIARPSVDTEPTARPVFRPLTTELIARVAMTANPFRPPIVSPTAAATPPREGAVVSQHEWRNESSVDLQPDMAMADTVARQTMAPYESIERETPAGGSSVLEARLPFRGSDPRIGTAAAAPGKTTEFLARIAPAGAERVVRPAHVADASPRISTRWIGSAAPSSVAGLFPASSSTVQARAAAPAATGAGAHAIQAHAGLRLPDLVTAFGRMQAPFDLQRQTGNSESAAARSGSVSRRSPQHDPELPAIFPLRPFVPVTARTLTVHGSAGAGHGHEAIVSRSAYNLMQPGDRSGGSSPRADGSPLELTTMPGPPLPVPPPLRSGDRGDSFLPLTGLASRTGPASPAPVRGDEPDPDPGAPAMVVPVAPTASLRVGAPVLLRKVWPTTSRPAHQFLLASESPVFGGGVEAHVFRHTPRVDSHRERLGEHSSSADGADAGSPLTAAAGTGWSELPLVRRFVARDQHERDNTLASTVTRSSVAVLQRQELPATSSGAASAAAPEPAAAAEASKQAGAAGADIEELLDRLSRRLWRELAIERERRGTGPWL